MITDIRSHKDTTHITHNTQYSAHDTTTYIWITQYSTHILTIIFPGVDCTQPLYDKIKAITILAKGY